MASNNQRRFLKGAERIVNEPDLFNIVDDDEDVRSMEFAKIIDKPKGPLFILFMLQHPRIKFGEGTLLYTNVSDEFPSIIVVHRDGTFTVDEMRKRGEPVEKYRVKSLWKAVNLTGNKGNSGWNNVYIRRDTYRGGIGPFQSMNDFFFSCWEYIKDDIDLDVFLDDERLYGYLVEKGWKSQADNLYVSEAEKARIKAEKEKAKAEREAQKAAAKKSREAKIKEARERIKKAPKTSSAPRPKDAAGKQAASKKRGAVPHLRLVDSATISGKEKPLKSNKPATPPRGDQASLFDNKGEH